jgi:hypothetical protein
MITFTDIQQHINVPFEIYQKLPGLSTSFLKQEKNGVKPDFVMTDKVRVGSLVDSILTEPGKADMSSLLYPTAKDIAFRLKKEYPFISNLMPQVSYTALAEHQGFKMRVRGRLDYLLPLGDGTSTNLAVVDLKVTYSSEAQIKALIEHMRYDEQMFLYCKFAKVKVAYLMFYCVPKKKCILEKIQFPDTSTWWEEKIINHGKVDEPIKPSGLIPNNDFLNG